MSVILPGATIGILGGGQLGRMTAMAARSMGYRVQVMDPDPSCPARFVVDSCFQGDWNDTRAAANLARGCDVVTLEIEQISIASLEAASKYAPVRPGVSLMAIIQDRIAQKDWLADNDVPLGPYAAIRSEAELRAAVPVLGNACFLKSARGGYDGRSQARIGFQDQTGSLDEQIESAWRSLGGADCVAEKALFLEQEISVMVARSPSGEVRTYPSACNFHEHQILTWSVIPSNIPDELEFRAQVLARRIADALDLEGLLAVEMFITGDGELFVNELAPRPHNSYHASAQACATSQFEQAVRAVCNLPLGQTDVIRPAAIANLLGDLWLQDEPRFDRALAIPGVQLHLYEKALPRKGRKMGHLSAGGETPKQAVNRVLEAMAQL